MKTSHLIAIALTLTSNAIAAEVDGLSFPYKTVTVSSPVQEIVAEVLVDEGTAVTAGQPLARLLDEKEKIEFQRAETVYAKREFDDNAARSLAKDKILSKQEELKAKAELDLARLDRDLAKALLDEKTIHSPIAGTVVTKHREPGESVDRIGPLFEIVDVSKLFLQFYVEPSVARHLKQGQPISFTIESDPGKPRTAKVDFVSPAADPSSGLFRTKLLFENPESNVLSGLRVTADFPTTEN